MRVKVFYAHNDSEALEQRFNEWVETEQIDHIHQITVVATGRLDHNVTMTVFYYPN